MRVILFVTTLALFSCQSKTESEVSNADVDTLENKIVFFGSFSTGQMLHYYYFKNINQEVSRPILFDSDTTVYQQIETLIPLEININEGPSVINYLFFPKDEIHFTYEDRNYYLLSSGDSIRQNELDYQREFHPSISVNLFAGGGENYEKEKASLLKNYNYWTEHLDAAFEQKKISDSFYEYYHRFLTSKLMIGLLYPVFSKQYKHLNLVTHIDQELVKGILKEDGKYLGMNTYRYAVWHYLRYLTAVKSPKVTAETLVATAVDEFSGEIRDFLLARIFSETIENTEIGAIEDVNHVINNVEGDFYKDYILSATRLKQVPDGMLLTSNGQTVAIKDLFSSAGDSLLYVDFWASWCAPCKEEMKYYPKLMDDVRDKKVQFLFLSMDKNASDWKDVAKDYKIMTAANSFLVGSNFKSGLAKDLKIQSIPRYIIVKNGRIVVADAERPSSKTIVQQLRQVLEK